MRVAVLGAGGMLGHDLVTTAPRDVELLAFRHTDLDVTDPAAIGRLFVEHHPEVVINAAAYTAVDKAEEETELADRVNGWAPAVLGAAAAREGCRVVHFSTDYVFDGTATVAYPEDAPTNPVNRYGASKLMGERALQASGAETLIIRTQWLFGVHGRSFPRTMWERALARRPTRVVSDQFGRPTFTEDLARATWQVVGRDVASDGDILHITNAGTASWYQLARLVFDHHGATDSLASCATSDYPTPAKRPRRAILDTSRAQTLLPKALPTWEDAIERFMADLDHGKS